MTEEDKQANEDWHRQWVIKQARNILNQAIANRDKEKSK